MGLRNIGTIPFEVSRRTLGPRATRRTLIGDPVSDYLVHYRFNSLIDAVNSPEIIDAIARPDIRALRFNGIDQYVDKASDASLFVGIKDSFSVCFWFKPVLNATTGSIRSIIAYGESGTGLDGFAIQLPSDGTKLRFRSNGAGYNSDGDIVWDKWNFGAFTHDGVTKKLYLNADPSTDRADIVMNTFNSEIFNIGCNTNANGSFFWGDLDSFRIYNRAITATEIGLIRDYIDQRLRMNGELLTFEGEYVEFEQRAWI